MEKITVREALRRASSYLSELPDSSFVAEILIRHVLGCSRTHFFARLNEEISSEQWAQIQALMKQRMAGTPVQYLTGEQEFYGLPFKVNPSVLIPRPETEILVEQVLARRNPQDLFVAADIGTGSGAIAVSLAAHSSWKILAVDIAQETLDTAAENSRIHGVADRITFLRGDLLDPIRQKVDILVSNPPYIPTADIAELDVQVREGEPLRALDGGEDGLDFYRRICAGLPRVLKVGGLVAFEVGIGQAGAVKQLLLETGVIDGVDILKDLAGIDRIVIGE